MTPTLELDCHAERDWLSPALLDAYRSALNALLPELLQAPPGPDHVLSELDHVELSIVDDPTIARVHADYLNDR